ncbi:MAG TPA: Gfo/Idh/MocA family oxidoreductase [Candidatus Brocadiia bacterium]|nr:Gfo/Idh/MocA family oxidoreductase [Candidatus Brocadiia bacterium]
MKRLRVGIIGQGRSGRSIHAAHLMALKDKFEIVAVVDPIAIRRESAVRDLGCEAYEDYKPLLKRKDLDLVVNATPSYLHVPVTLEILKAGHNCLCEKPFAKTPQEVDKMIAAAKKARKILAVYQQSRFAPYFTKVMEVIKSGVLGRIVQISIAFNGYSRRYDWQTLTSWNGGSLLNTGPHPLDQALRFLDLPLDQMPEVFCHMDRANTYGDAEDHVKLIMRAPGRPLIDLEISSCAAYPLYTYHVYGTRGGLKGSTTSAEWKYFKPSECPKLKLTVKPIAKEDGAPAYCSDQIKWHEDKWEVAPEDRELFHSIGSRFYNMLYDHMVNKKPLLVTPQQVRQQIAVIQECQRQNPQIWGKNAKKPAAVKKCAPK